ncbi:hypothetical protein NFI96_020653, partial [Prochilodus magdalenae]
VDARNVDGSTPLCEACSVGSFECVQMLLDFGAKVNPALTSRTTSPLHEACMGGNAECVKLVLSKGASLEAYDLYNGTPLHVACVNQHLECVKVLLNAGAKVNAARLHETALHHAAKANNMEMIQLLVEFGANVYAKDKQERRPSDYTRPETPPALCLQLYESEHGIATGVFGYLIVMTVNRPPTKVIQPAVSCGQCPVGSVLWAVSCGQRPVGQRPVGQRPVGQRPVGQRTPLSLQQLSRIVLRTMLGPRALQAVPKLNLPNRIISYLCYQ